MPTTVLGSIYWKPWPPLKGPDCICREQRAVEEGLARAMIMARNASIVTEGQLMMAKPMRIRPRKPIEKEAFFREYAKTLAALDRFGLSVDNADSASSAHSPRLVEKFDKYRSAANLFTNALVHHPAAYNNLCPRLCIEVLVKAMDELTAELKLDRPFLFVREFFRALKGEQMRRRELHSVFTHFTHWLVERYHILNDEHDDAYWETGAGVAFQTARVIKSHQKWIGLPIVEYTSDLAACMAHTRRMQVADDLDSDAANERARSAAADVFFHQLKLQQSSHIRLRTFA